MFNSVTDPTAIALVGLVVELDAVVEVSSSTARVGYNRMSQTIDVEQQGRSGEPGHQHRTARRRPTSAHRPSTSARSGYIGGVGGYPITTSPTQTYDVSTSLTQSREQHTVKVGGNWQMGTNHSVRNRARDDLHRHRRRLVSTTSTRWSACCSAGSISPADRSARRRATCAQQSFGAFINDDWKLSPRVTVSGGLRYDFNTPITEVNNLASNFISGSGPRPARRRARSTLPIPTRTTSAHVAGVAWDVMGDGKTSVRSGYALTYDLPDFKTVHSPNTTWSGLGARAGAMTNPDLNTTSVTLTARWGVTPDARTATCINPNASALTGDYVCVQPGVAIFGSSPSGAPPFNAFSIPTDYRTPMYHYFHATVQQRAGQGQRRDGDLHRLRAAAGNRGSRTSTGRRSARRSAMRRRFGRSRRSSRRSATSFS